VQVESPVTIPPSGGDPVCTASPTVTGNLISDPSFESDGAGWDTTGSWGTNDAALSITTDANFSDCKAANVTITTYTSGDAKWASNAVSATGKYFIYTEWYKSSTTTQVGYFDQNDKFYWLADLPSTNNVWTQYQTDILVPIGATSIKMAHILFSTGTLTTDDYSLVEQTPPIFAHGLVTLSFDDGWQTFSQNAFPILQSAGLKSTAYVITLGNSQDPGDYMSTSTLLSLQNSGLVEIGDHTRNHADLVRDDPAQFGYADQPAMVNGEVISSRTDLTRQGFSPVLTFAYPYGSYRNIDNSINTGVRTALTTAGFTSARSVDDGFNLSNTDKFALKQKHITNTTTYDDVRNWIDTATSTKTWLILMFHDVRPALDTCVDRENPDIADQDCTDTALLQQIATYLTSAESKQPHTVITVTQGIAAMNGADITAPAIAITSPAQGSTLATATTTLSGTTDDNVSAVHISLNNKVYTATPSSGAWSVAMPDEDALSNGTYTITASSTDTAGNTGNASAVTFTVSVQAPNNPPAAQAQSISLDKNTTKDITLSGSDLDALDTIVLATTTSPAHGTLSGTLPTLTYTPNTDYVGADSFDFSAGDGKATTTATISITVNDVSAPPSDPTPPPSGGGGGPACCSGGGGGGYVVGLLGSVTSNSGGQVLGASTQLLTDAQIDAILNLLKSFDADQSVIDNVSKALHGEATGGSTTGFVFTKTLQTGSTGDEVTELQKRLAQEGVYSGPVTGYFGALTKAAVIAYQKKYGLDQAGVVGPKTRAKLNGQ
jgi:peptidoglycan/xylan/chitin deacetylase (PgdA/CDA1 family)